MAKKFVSKIDGISPTLDELKVGVEITKEGKPLTVAERAGYTDSSFAEMAEPIVVEEPPAEETPTQEEAPAAPDNTEGAP